MVWKRGLESWRRMSRFRRNSQVKPMAAEVLEPRCVLTTVSGFEISDGIEVLEIAASQWTNAGLTVRVAAGLSFRSGFTRTGRRSGW